MRCRARAAVKMAEPPSQMSERGRPLRSGNDVEDLVEHPLCPGLCRHRHRYLLAQFLGGKHTESRIITAEMALASTMMVCSITMIEHST